MKQNCRSTVHSTCLVLHHLEADHQAFTTDVAHTLKLLTQTRQSFQQIAADDLRQFLTTIFFDDLQSFHRHACIGHGSVFFEPIRSKPSKNGSRSSAIPQRYRAMRMMPFKVIRCYANRRGIMTSY